MIKIAVIIPTFNRPHLLVNCLSALSKQTYTNWIAYIIDDCSITNTEESIKDILHNDKRIKYFKLDHNSGVNYARNYGLDRIRDEKAYMDYITFLDDDDYFKDDYFQNIYSLILKEGTKPWIVSKCIDKNNNTITKIKYYGEINYIDYLSNFSMTGDATMMIRTDAIKDIRFSDEIKNGLEWYFFLQIASKYSMFVVNIDSKVVNYQPNGLSQSKLPYNKQKLLKKYLPIYGFNYYSYLSRKHYGKYINNTNIISYLKYIVYKTISFFK